MTVSTTTSGVTRTGDGVTLEFSFSFEARLAAEIFVSEIVGLALVAVDPADYVVAIEPDGVGGTVTFTVAPINGANLYIFRETAQTQLVSVSNQTRYNPEVVEGVWDKLAFLIQELTELANRSVKTVPGGDPDALIETLEASAASAEADAASAEADAAAAAASAAAAALFDPGNLAGLLALTLSANKLAYPTGASSWALTDFTAAARALLDDADAATMRATLGLVIGTNVQAYDADLAAIAALADPNADRILFWDDSASAMAFLTPTPSVRVVGTEITSGLLPQTLWAAASGTQNDWLSFPAGVTEIEVLFDRSSLSATGRVLVQMMVAGVAVTTGYTGGGDAAGITNAFAQPWLTGSVIGIGKQRITRREGVAGAATWIMDNGAAGCTGSVTLAGEVTGIRVLAGAGAFNTPAGGINVAYR